MKRRTEPRVRRRNRDADTYPSTVEPERVSTPRTAATDTPITPARPDTQPGDTRVPERTRRHAIDQNRAVETIERAAEEIRRTTHGLFTDGHRDSIDRWLGLHGLDRDAADAHELLARQAAVQLLLKATLYEHHHRRGDLPELSDDIRPALRRARRRTDEPAFDESVLDEFAFRADDPTVAGIVENRHRLLASTQPAEDIARVYEAVLPGDTRRALGQFRTLPDVADLMRWWAARGADTVLDPGLGAGALSSPYHPDWDLSTDPERVVGIDRSPLSRLMGATALTLGGQSHDTRATDFLRLAPDNAPTEVDAVVCNPPYTAGDTLDPADKREYRAAARRASGDEIDGRSPLYAYFLYHCRRFLDAGDRAAVITPQAYLAAEYGRPLKRFLLDRFEIKAFVLFDPETVSAFDGPLTTGLIAFLEAADGTGREGVTRFVRIDDPAALRRDDGSRDWRPVRDVIDGNANDAGDWGVVNPVDRAELAPERNWQALFDPVDVNTDDLHVLGDFVTVSRGPTTGKVDFFCLSEPEVRDAKLDETHLSRIVRRPSHIDGYDYRKSDWETARTNGKEVWLLDPDELSGVPDTIAAFSRRSTTDDARPVEDASDEGGDSNLIEYLRTGIAEHDLTDTTTFEARPHWYRPPRKDPTRVLVQSAGRDGFRFALNEAGVRNTNACYGLYDIGLTDRRLKALLAYLNSGVFADVFREHYRTLDGGFKKAEPGDFESTPVIDPTELDADRVATLADAFDALRRTARRGGNPDPVLDRIDAELRRAL